MRTLILGEHDGNQLKLVTKQTIGALTTDSEMIDLLLIGHNLNAVAETARQIRVTTIGFVRARADSVGNNGKLARCHGIGGACGAATDVQSASLV